MKQTIVWYAGVPPAMTYYTTTTATTIIIITSWTCGNSTANVIKQLEI